MMCMVYVLVSVTAICALLCLVELFVHVWEKAERRSGNTARPVMYAPAAPALRNHVARLTITGSLPDREAVGKVYSLSDHFADHFMEVVNS